MGETNNYYLTQYAAGHIYLPPDKMKKYLNAQSGSFLDVIFENSKLVISKHDPERERKEKRAKWVEKYYRRAQDDNSFNWTIRGHLTIGTFTYSKEIYTAYPVKGDKYDRRTGIAVCYAESIGHTVPDYI